MNKLNQQLELLSQKYGNQVKIILTDVRHAPQVLGLIQDGHIVFDDKKIEEPDELQSKLTVRFLNYGYMFNSKSKKTYNLQDVQNDETLQLELVKDDPYIFPLKYKPRSLSQEMSDLGPSLSSFVDDCLNVNLKPHLEAEENNLNDEIPRVSPSSWDKIVSKSRGRYLAIEVIAQTCQGCKSVEAVLPQLKERLLNEGMSLCQANLMTELPWLQDVQVTPSFLVYDKRTKMFKTVDTETEDETDREAPLEELLAKRIVKAVKWGVNYYGELNLKE